MRTMRKLSAAILAMCGLVLMMAEPITLDLRAYIVPVSGLFLLASALFLVRNEEVGP